MKESLRADASSPSLVEDLQAEIQRLRQQVAALQAANEQLARPMAVPEASHSEQFEPPMVQMIKGTSASEYELIAQERAVRLARANATLMRSLTRLTSYRDLDSFLGYILEEALQNLDGVSAQAFLYDLGCDTLTAYVGVDENTTLRSPSANVQELLDYSQPFPANITPAWAIALASRSPVFFDIERDENFYWPGTADYHRARGCRGIVCTALLMGDDPLGLLCLTFKRTTFSAAEFEFFQTLGQQAALAIQMARLAEEAEHSAIAQERERAAQQRVMDLERANGVLKRSLDALATEPSLEKFLGQVLRAIAEQLQAPVAEYWSHADGEMAFIGMMSYNGRILNRGEIAELHPDHPGLDGFRVPPELIHGEDLLHRKKYFIIDDWFSSPLIPEDSWILLRGLCKEINVPMVFGDITVGALIVRLACNQQITPQQIELVQSLTHQATLALRLTQLAEEAKQVAIAQQQEIAARQRVAELTKANHALKRSLDALTANPDLDSFIGKVLAAIAQQFNAVAVEFWGHRDSKVAYPIALVVGGKIVSLDEMADHPWRDGLEIPPEMVNHEPLDRRTRHFVIEDTRTDPRSADYWPQERDWYEARGVTLTTQINMPLMLGGKSPGALAIYLQPNAQITDEQIEISYALVHQLSLAVELTRLAEQSREAAVAQEREIAAQQQATELSNANSLLRNSLSRLSSNPNLSSVLGHLLVEVVRYAGAAVGHIFIFDAEQQALKFHVRCRDEQAFWFPAEDEPDLFRNPLPMQEVPIFTHLCQHPRLAILNQEAFEGNLWPGVTEWFQSKGYQGTSSSVLMVGDRPFGMLAMACHHPITLSSVEEELILALVQQIALVVQLTVLGEADKRAAIAQEQEKAAQEWATELARANAALRQSIDALTTQPTIEAFLSVTLRSIADVLEVPSACLWRYEGELAYLRLVYQDGQVLPAEQTNHVNAHKPAALSESSYSEDGNLRSQPHFHHIDDLANCLTDEQRHMFKQLGVRCLLLAPIVIGNQVVGSITARLTYDMPDPNSSHLKLIHTLANQAALALQMSRLAEEAKQAVLLEERNRMAQDIHDTLAQAFTGILIQLDAIRNRSLDICCPALVQIQQLAENGLAEARRSVRALRPRELDNGNLYMALQYTVDQMAAKTSVTLKLNICGDRYLLPVDTAGNLLRIAQEAIYNALKHAQSNAVWIDLLYEPETVMLSIEDDGQGFDPQQQLLPTGFGIIGMQERADRIGGQFSLRSSPGNGTTITVIVENLTSPPTRP